MLQWRLHHAARADLVTGLKHDIELLQRVQANRGDQVLVCDISMRRNLSALTRLLQEGVQVSHFDHHQVDSIPEHPLLDAHIDLASDTCTSLLVDHYLEGTHSAWATVGAFGDNLTQVADQLAAKQGLHIEDRRRLQSLGEAINYNAYGESVKDVYILPEQLLERMMPFSNPLNFLDQDVIDQELATRRQQDMQLAQGIPAYFENAEVSVYLLPDVAWSRRVIGNMGNSLALAHPKRAHALLRADSGGGYSVSVRAPLLASEGAASFCKLFGGDGRAAAAGIDHLPAQQMDSFMKALSAMHWAMST